MLFEHALIDISLHNIIPIAYHQGLKIDLNACNFFFQNEIFPCIKGKYSILGFIVLCYRYPKMANNLSQLYEVDLG